MRKSLLGLACCSLALAFSAFSLPLFAQDATETPDPGMMATEESMDMGMDMMGSMSHVRIAYIVQDGPSVDVYVRMSGMGDMSADMSATEEMAMDATMDPAMSGDMMMGESELGFLINTLDPNIVTDFLSAPAGSYEVTITAAGDTAPVVGPLPVDLMGGEFLTVVVIGSVTNGDVQIVAVNEDLASYTAGGASVTVINAIAGSPSVDVQTDDGIVLVSGLTYIGDMAGMDAGTSGDMTATEEMAMDATMDPAMSGDTMMGAMLPMSAYTPTTVFVPAEFLGTYNIRIINPADGTELAAFDGVEVAADTGYLIVAYSADGATAQIATGVSNLAEVTSMDMMATEAMPMEMTATPGA